MQRACRGAVSTHPLLLCNITIEPEGMKGSPAGQPQPKLLLRHAEPTGRAAITCEMALLKGSQLIVAHPELLLYL